MENKGKIDQGLADAGWEPDGTFSDHLSIGNSGSLCILAHLRTWKTGAPTYELYDVERHVSYCVRELTTPGQTATLLEEHGQSLEEE